MIGLVLFQAATTAVPPERIDLLAPAPEQCTAEGDNIVVCGRPVDQRLKPLEVPNRGGPPDGPLSFRLPGGGTGKVYAIQTTLPGAIGKGVAVTLKIPLGKHQPKPTE